MKKTFCLFLSLITLLSLAVSCSDSNVNEAETEANISVSPESEMETEPEEVTSKYLDDLPETMDLGGYAMRFIVEEGGNGNLSALSITAEEDTGEVVDSAVFNRNLSVQERLNISIDLVNVVAYQELPNILSTSVMADSNEYDVVGTYQYYGIKMGPEGLVLNLSNLENLDFSREYWGTDYIENMSYKGITYWATGDLALRYTGGMYATYINQDMWTDRYHDVNMYDFVREGGWTLDALYNYSNNIYEDLNGNGRIDVFDLYGFFFNLEDPVEGMAAGSMVNFSQVDEDGKPYVSLGDERSYTFYEKMYNIVHNNTGLWYMNDDNNTVMKIFSEGRSLFCINKIFQSGVFLREMEEEFIIIPVPKLDESQEHYNTTLHDGVTLFGIPITNKVVDETCIVLECMASESLKTVTPAYYDVALKVKYARDTESGMMIDLIRENVSSDFAAVYSNSIGNVAHFFRNNLKAKNEAIASDIAKNQNIWKRGMERLIEDIESNAD